MIAPAIQDPLAPLFHVEEAGSFRTRNLKNLPDLWASHDRCYWILTLGGSASYTDPGHSHQLSRGWIVMLAKPPIQHLKLDPRSKEEWSGLLLCASNSFTRTRMEYLASRFGAIHEISPVSSCVRLARRLVLHKRKDAWTRAALAFEWFHEWWKEAEMRHWKMIRLLGSPITAKYFAREASSLKNLAARLGYSPGHLSGTLSKKWGETPSILLRRERMSLAAQRLVETDINVAVLAQELGYQSPSSFIRLFRQTHGLPPAKYRKAHRADV